MSELRYGALVAGWGQARRDRLDESIQTATVVPVSDRLLSTVAELRFACRKAGHPLHDRAHANDLWIAASARHIDAPLLTADNVFSNTRTDAPPVERLSEHGGSADSGAERFGDGRTASEPWVARLLWPLLAGVIESIGHTEVHRAPERWVRKTLARCGSKRHKPATLMGSTGR